VVLAAARRAFMTGLITTLALDEVQLDEVCAKVRYVLT
jgi:hypothetical protein